MADRDNNNKEMVGITRIIEYYGPKEWIEQIIANSRVPLQGSVNYDKLSKGAYIKSGVVMWNVAPEPIRANVDELAPNIPIEDNSNIPDAVPDSPKLKPFPRPGGRI